MLGWAGLGSDGCRRSADAEQWSPCWPDIARGNRGGVGSGSTELAEVLAYRDFFLIIRRGFRVKVSCLSDAICFYQYFYW